jgi:hypothetical protein
MEAILHSPWTLIATALMAVMLAVLTGAMVIVMMVVTILTGLDRAVSPWPHIWFLSLVVRPQGWHSMRALAWATLGVAAIAAWFYWLGTPRRKVGRVEFSVPRQWARTVIWGGRAVASMGFLVALLSIALNNPAEETPTGLMVPVACFFIVWGLFAARQSRKIEFGANGVRFTDAFYRWSDLDKFEWFSDSGTATLRIKIKDLHKPGQKTDLRIPLAEDGAVARILLTHGLERW